MAMLELAVAVRSARERRELSLRDVRDSSGLALSYLHRIERGRVVEPSPSTLRRLAAALDVPYIDLMRVAGYL